MRLLISDEPADAISHRFENGAIDVVWHLDHQVSLDLKRSGHLAVGTPDIIPDVEIDKLRREIVHWLDAIGGSPQDDVSLRRLAACGPYSLWEPVRQSAYSNLRSEIRNDRLLFAVACLQKLFQKYPALEEITCDVQDAATLEAVRQFGRTRGIKISLRSRLIRAWLTPYRDAAKWLAIEIARCVKEFGYWALAVVRRVHSHRARSFAIYVSYAPMVTSKAMRADAAGLGLLRDQLARRGQTALNVVIDYSRRFNLSLVKPGSADIALEAFMSPKDFMDALRLALRIRSKWHRVRRGWREQKTLVFSGIDLSSTLMPQLAYYAFIFVPKSIVYVNAFNRAFSQGPRCVFMIGEYSRLGQCAIIAARASNVIYCGLQHGRIDVTHSAYLPPPPALRTMYPLPDVFFAFGRRDLRFLERHFPDLANVTKVVGNLNHDRLYDFMVSDRAGLKAQLGIPIDAFLVTIFDNDLNPKALLELVEDLEQLIRTDDIWCALHPHPRSVFPDSHFRAILQGRTPQFLYTAGLDSYLLLAVSDVVVGASGASTTLAEAAAASRPTYFAAWNNRAGWKASEEEFAQPLLDRDALRLEIQQRLRSRPAGENGLATPPSGECFLVDGQVARRIADFIHKPEREGLAIHAIRHLD